MASWRRITSIAGLAAGASVAAVAGGVLAAEKVAVGRLRLRPDPEADEPLGQLRGRALTVLADDGVPLHAEIDGRDDALVTVVFCHGYALNQDVWHYQRSALADVARLVLWDHRGHGRSGRSAAEPVSVSQLGADLRAVLAAAVPGDGPVVLVGHSMGGMAIMALARQHPELFGTKVAGAVLIATTASGVDPVVWLPAPLRPIARQAATPVLRGVSEGWRASAVERAWNAAGDLAFLSTRFGAFGDGPVSPAVVDFLERTIRATPIGVIADFYPALLKHDERAALPVLARVPVIVVAAEQDRVVPLRQGKRLAEGIAGSELIVVPGAGHGVILEQPEVISDAIGGLVERVAAGAAFSEIRVDTAAQMRDLGQRLAALLHPGDLVVLTGPLGAGKTTLVQGIGLGLGVRGPVTSPTFVIARVHPNTGDGPPLVHADAYRLGSRAEVDDLDLDADLDSSVTAVEWGEGLVEDLAQDRLHIEIAMEHPVGDGPAEAPAAEPRIVRLSGKGKRWEATAESTILALSSGLEAL